MPRGTALYTRMLFGGVAHGSVESGAQLIANMHVEAQQFKGYIVAIERGETFSAPQF